MTYQTDELIEKWLDAFSSFVKTVQLMLEAHEKRIRALEDELAKKEKGEKKP